MSAAPFEETAEALRAGHAATAALGCPIPSPYIVLSFVGLYVVPDFGVTERGLVDAYAQQFVDVLLPGPVDVCGHGGAPVSTARAAASRIDTRRVAVITGVVVVVVAVAAALILFAGADPVTGLQGLVAGVSSSPYRVGELLVGAVPVAIIALTLIPALRAGVFSVGAEGRSLWARSSRPPGSWASRPCSVREPPASSSGSSARRRGPSAGRSTPCCPRCLRCAGA